MRTLSALLTPRWGRVLVASTSILLTVTAPILAGCGGGSGTQIPVENISPFAGAYSGPWQFTSGVSAIPNQTGTMTVAIDANGNITGSLNNTTLSQTGALNAHVDDTGAVTGTYVSGGSTNRATGTLSLTSGGSQLTGTFDVAQQVSADTFQTFGQVSFTLHR